MQKKMFFKHMFETYRYWICIFVVYAPSVVQALNKCSKLDVCKCSTDEGIIDLWSLAGTGSNIPRFKESVKGGQEAIKVYWNPCNKWTQESSSLTAPNNCIDIAVCYDSAGFMFSDIGEQGTANFNFNSTLGTCVLSLKGKALQSTSSPPSSSTHIILQCDPDEEGRLESVAVPTNVDNDFQMLLKLHSKYACPKSGLSTGSILIIVCISLLVVYLVAGLLFNKFHKGATGKEMIPNVNFWTDFPLLVKDGVVFSYQCCKNICSRKHSSYESI